MSLMCSDHEDQNGMQNSICGLTDFEPLESLYYSLISLLKVPLANIICNVETRGQLNNQQYGDD